MAPVNTGNATGVKKSGSSLYWTHTIAAGDDQVLYVMVYVSAGRTVTYFAYNSLPMSKIYTNTSAGIQIWRLVNAPVGTYNVSVAWSGLAEGIGISASYKDVETTLPNNTEVATSGSGVGSHPSATIASTVNSINLDFTAATLDATITFNDSAGQTDRGKVASDDTLAYFGASEKAGAASVTMAHTLSPASINSRWWQVIYTLNPKSAVTKAGFFGFF